MGLLCREANLFRCWFKVPQTQVTITESYIRTHARAHTYSHMRAHTQLHTTACRHTHIHTPIYTRTLAHTYTHAHTLTHTHTRVHTNKHTHTHKQAHTHTHTHTYHKPNMTILTLVYSVYTFIKNHHSRYNTLILLIYRVLESRASLRQCVSISSDFFPI